MVRRIFIAVVVVHGLIHLMGFAKAFGLAELPQLSQAISRAMGVVWLVAAVLMLGTAVALVLAPRWWWAVGAVALVVSQVAIVGSWHDARFGTLANALLLVGGLYGVLSLGPLSLRAADERAVADAPPVGARAPLTEADLAPLPAPVQRDVRAAGVVGRPPVHDFRWTLG